MTEREYIARLEANDPDLSEYREAWMAVETMEHARCCEPMPFSECVEIQRRYLDSRAQIMRRLEDEELLNFGYSEGYFEPLIDPNTGVVYLAGDG